VDSDLDDLRERLRRFADDRDWHRFHTPKNLAMALAGETGELVAELQWLTEEQIQAGLLQGALRQRLADEMADVLIYLVRLSDVTSIDLLSEAAAKIDRNEDRYPVELSRGNAAKYTDLHDRSRPEPETDR
jgi:NTP pyrophosphatase (non-canonical NTP hydrolase)